MRELPRGWINAEIGEVSDYLQRGKSPQYTTQSDLPVINQKCVRWWGIDETHLKYVHPDQWESWAEERFLRNGDILWNSTGTGTIGRAALFRGLQNTHRAVVDSHVTIVRCNWACAPEYLFKYIQSPAIQDRISDMHTGSTNQVELSKTEIVQTKFPLPPLAEQRRIVAKLDSLFARTQHARAEAHRSLSLIEHLEQATLSKAFRGDLTFDWRDARGLTEEVGTRSKGSGGMNELPRGWAITELGNLLDRLQYGLTAKADASASGTRFARITDIEDFSIKWDAVPGVTNNTQNAKYRLRHGDFLFARTGSIEKACRVETPPDAVFASYLIRGHPVEEDLSDWLCWYIRSQEYMSQIYDRASGIGRSNVNAQKLSTIEVPLAPLPEQRHIVAKLDSLFARTQHARAEAHRSLSLIEHLEQATLAKAFRGELMPQDLNDESASVLLERIHAERATKPKLKRGRRRAAH